MIPNYRSKILASTEIRLYEYEYKERNKNFSLILSISPNTFNWGVGNNEMNK